MEVMIPAERMPTCLRRLWRRGIGFRLAVLVVMILLPFAALLAVIFEQRYDNRRKSALQTETEVAQGLAITFAAYIQGIHKQSLAVGDAIRILSPVNRAGIQELLITSVDHSISVLTMSWVSPEGSVLGSSIPQKTGVDLSGNPYFKTAATGRAMVLGDLETQGAVSGRPSVLLATPIRNASGGLDGVVVAEIDPSTLGQVMLSRRNPSDAVLSLFDRHGVLVYHSSPPWEKRGYWRQAEPLVLRTLRSGTLQKGERDTVRKGDGSYLSALIPVQGTGWVAAASRSSRSAFGEVRHGMLLDSMLGTVVFALAFLFAYMLGRNIVAPLRRMEHDAALMAAGKEVPRDDYYAPREVASLRATMLAMTADLTEHTRQLQQSEELLRAVFENVYDAIVIHDGVGRVVEVNQRWLQMFRMRKDEVKNLTIGDISAAPPAMEELLPFWKEVLDGETKIFEWRARRPGDKSDFDVEVFLCPIRLKGEGMIMACVRDITERKRTAQELQEYREELETRVKERTEDLDKAIEAIRQETAQRLATADELRRKEQLLIQQSRLAAMGEMMGNIAHQWRQPLNVLGLIVQELKISYQKGMFNDELLNDSVTKAMKVIGHMSQTIEDFRNLLSPDKAKEVFEAKEAIEKVLSLLQLRAKVEVVAEDACPMEGARNEFSQVIINLIANAHDVFKERNIENPQIWIRLFREGGRSVITVTDNAGGIDVEVIDRIFDPYFTTKGPDQGTGVGLFMSKTIIEKSMSGRLTVRNTGTGAEFRIEV